MKMKCKECDTFKNFVLYKDRVSFALHIVCHDNKHNHYDKVPFMKRIGSMDILERDSIMRSLIYLFFFSFCILILLMCLFHLWIVAFMLLAIFLMWEYVFIQLHIDDIYAVHVFEISFNNETKHNLQNMCIANSYNRTYEIIRPPIFKRIYHELQDFNNSNFIINFTSRIVIVRLVVALFIMIHRYKVRYTDVRKYLLRTPEMYGELNNEICQRQELLDIIKSKKEEFEGISLKVLGIEYIEKTLLYNCKPKVNN